MGWGGGAETAPPMAAAAGAGSAALRLTARALGVPAVEDLVCCERFMGISLWCRIGPLRAVVGQPSSFGPLVARPDGSDICGCCGEGAGGALAEGAYGSRAAERPGRRGPGAAASS